MAASSAGSVSDARPIENSPSIIAQSKVFQNESKFSEFLHSDMAVVALIVGAIAGVVILALGLSLAFGPLGSIGFIASVLIGGAMTAFSALGIFWNISSIEEQPIKEQPIEEKIEEEAILFAERLLQNPSAIFPNPSEEELPALEPAVNEPETDADGSVTESKSNGSETASDAASDTAEIERNPLEISPYFLEGIKKDHPHYEKIALLLAFQGMYVDRLLGSECREEKIEEADRINYINACMQLSYAIVTLAIRPFLEGQAQGSDTKRFADSILDMTSQKDVSWQLLEGDMILQECFSIYHQIAKNGCNVPEKPRDCCYQACFFRQGTIQSQWRILYNRSCDLIAKYINGLSAAEQSTIKQKMGWLEKDETPDPNIEIFRPDSQ